jgi:Cu+-exporting ATPase
MTCASCVNRITRFLGKVDGVENANVNLASDMATVRFDPAATDLPTLRRLTGRRIRRSTVRGGSGAGDGIRTRDILLGKS